ncbi:MAG: hypothetical protein JSR83_05995 [Proteobacteria bacterium]|nr:hypothetical protein [Pseudomonadota bacterium]
MAHLRRPHFQWKTMWIGPARPCSASDCIGASNLGSHNNEGEPARAGAGILPAFPLIAIRPDKRQQQAQSEQLKWLAV